MRKIIRVLASKSDSSDVGWQEKRNHSNELKLTQLPSTDRLWWNYKMENLKWLSVPSWFFMKHRGNKDEENQSHETENQRIKIDVHPKCNCYNLNLACHQKASGLTGLPASMQWLEVGLEKTQVIWVCAPEVRPKPRPLCFLHLLRWAASSTICPLPCTAHHRLPNSRASWA